MEFKDILAEKDSAIAGLDKEISEKREEVKNAPENEEGRKAVEERSKEIDSLLEKRKSLMSEREKIVADHEAELSKKAAEAKENTEKERMKMENISLEERAKQFVSDIRTAKGAKLERSVLVASIGTPIAADGVTGQHLNYPHIVDLVSRETREGIGAVRFTYDKGDAAADIKASGAKANEGGAKLSYVELPMNHISVVDYVDEDILNESDVDVESHIQQKGIQAVLRKVGKLIVSGASNFYGLGTSVDKDGDKMYAEATLKALDENSLRKMMLAESQADEVYGPALIVINRNNLAKLGEIRGTADKKPVFEFNFDDPNNLNTGLITDGALSCRFVIDNALDDKTIYYGKGLGYKLVFGGETKVRISEDERFSEGLIAIKADAYVAGGITEKNSWTKVTVGTGA